MMDRDQIESRLSALAEAVDWPQPSDHLSARVATRLGADLDGPARRWSRRPAVAVAAVMVVALAISIVPATREAVANLLAAAGVRVGTTLEEAPPVGTALDLGEPVALAGLSEAARFRVRIPGDAELGPPPDAVYLNEFGQVNMVWAGSPALPAAGDTDVALLLTQERALPGDIAEKRLGPQTGVDSLVVEGRPALWIEGADHTFTVLDAAGRPIEETTRLAANVLLWEVSGVNHRLETTGDLDSALALVRTLEPLR